MGGMTKATTKNVTLEEYKNIQQLKTMGVSTKIISEVMGRTPSYISSIKTDVDFDTFRANQKARKARYTNKAALGQKPLQGVFTDIKPAEIKQPAPVEHKGLFTGKAYAEGYNNGVIAGRVQILEQLNKLIGLEIDKLEGGVNG